MDEVGQRQIALMIAARSGADDDGEHVDAMQTLLRLGALDATASDPDGSLMQMPDHPGYLERKVDGTSIFVPFNLAPVSPAYDILAEVARLSVMVRLGSANPICISGSTAFLGALKVIADLDFCEYYLLPAETAAEELRAAGDMPDLPLIWAKLRDVSYDRPMDQLAEIAGEFADTPGRLKLDFMSCGALGPMPTTSVILPTSDGEDGEADRSFVYQEILIGSVVPLRMLVAPNRFGGYIRFLMENARAYVALSDDHPPSAMKALKRILALMSALGDRHRVQTIVATLNRPEIEQVMTKVRVHELDAMQPNLPRGAPSHFAEQIDALRVEAALVRDDDVQEALSLARELATTLIAETESEFADYA